MDFLLAADTVASTASEATPQAAPGFGDLIPMFVIFAVMIGGWYLIILRPQRKRDKELKAKIDSMAVGDKILTIGGIIGTVANLREDEVTITTSVANTMMTFKKTAISTVTKKETGSD
ncbi:MAG: preprotein translocase subunit YajC [Clostridiaceae bacterium]|nr:preprotein translocase subunit YajC [Oscillospiraceae bacterium]NLO62109.1 preprotein translocase subunit YajC [Clostridiaceae bacterium]